MTHMQLAMNDFSIIGRGNYSTMLRGTLRGSGESVAVKAIRPYRTREPTCSKPSRSRLECVDAEEHMDIETEVYLLQNETLICALDWRWTPRVYAVYRGEEANHLRRSPLGFGPAAAIVMECMHSCLDQYLWTSWAAGHHDEACIAISDLMSALVAMHRLGLSHNDLMFRNVMVRKCAYNHERTAPPPQSRSMTLARANGREHVRVTWPVNPAYEVVLIDFGLSSVAEESPIRRSDPTGCSALATQADRHSQFASQRTHDMSLQTGRHPLEMRMDLDRRHGMVDLMCVAYSVRDLFRRGAASRCAPSDGALPRWCGRFLKCMEDEATKICKLHMEELVCTIFPRDIRHVGFKRMGKNKTGHRS